MLIPLVLILAASLLACAAPSTPPMPAETPTQNPTETPAPSTTPTLVPTPKPPPTPTPKLPPKPPPKLPPKPPPTSTPQQQTSLVVPVSQASEAWQSVRSDSGYLSVVKGQYADAEILSLLNGSFRIYVASMENHSIISLLSTDGLTWTLEDGIRVQNAAFPDTVQLSDGRVRMYFQRGMAICSVVSDDGGLNFVEEPGVRIKTGWHNDIDRDNVGASTTMRLSDGRFRMYYRAGIEDAVYFNGIKTVILSAISDDGLIWEAESGVRIDPQDWVSHHTPTNTRYVDGPEVVLTDTGLVKLYFWGVGIGIGVCLAESKDGLNFKEVQEVFHSQDTPTGMQPGDPTVLVFPDRPWLLYFGQGPEPPEAWGIWIAELIRP